MRLPQVFCPGFPRCGTTFIAAILNQHPEIHTPMKRHPVYSWTVKKEVNYFNKFNRHIFNKNSENEGFNRNMSEYVKFFREGKINIDMSICTAYDRESAERIRDTLGDIKILFFVRDKKEHQRSLKILGPNNTEHILLTDFDSYIEDYKKMFSEVMVVDLEEIKKKPRIRVREILQFIGVNDLGFLFDLDVHKHASEEMRNARTRKSI